MGRAVAAVLFLCALFSLLPVTEVHAETLPEAKNISDPDTVTAQQGFPMTSPLFDGDTASARIYKDGCWLTLEHPEGIGSLYVVFQTEYGTYNVTNNDTGERATLGENNFLHDYTDLEALFGTAPTSVTLSFENGDVRINEISVFTPGQVPDYIQKWELPAEGETDLVLFSAHGDDEQLFFAGLLPYYAGELDYQVQVVYLTNHRKKEPERCHEMLNGLYAVGVNTYPVFGPFDDQLTNSLEYAYKAMENVGVSREALLEFVVEQLRRFKPLVAVTHDINGEYGHGQHMLFADLLMQAVEISNDPAVYPELTETYGVWDVPKTYLHLYPENQIVMDWDQPLERFDGKTAYQVTKYLGYPCHKSQYNDFWWYLYPSDTAAGLKKHNPREYGLYRSTVGEDQEKNDFFENLSTYVQQAAEEARLEAERIAAEEAARQRSSEAVEQIRQAADRIGEQNERRLAEAEARRAEYAGRSAEAPDSAPKDLRSLLTWCLAGLLSAVGLLFCIRRLKQVG